MAGPARGLNALGAQGSDGVLHTGLLAAAHHHLGPFLAQAPGDAQPDASGAGRHQRDLALEAASRRPVHGD